ncbi:MAG: hypothetical protein GY943_27130 [Chloroflexi bacterium]|nr:hypothetical protein [Chloroflexota bacterium]
MISQDSFNQNSSIDPPQPKTRSGTLILWLVVLGLMVLFIPLYFVATTLQTNVVQLESDLAPLEAALTVEPQSPSTELSQSLSEIQAQVDQFAGVAPALTVGNINWPDIINTIRNVDSAQLALTSITQSDNQLIITGRAVDDTAVIDYARELETSGQFKRVVVESIVLVTTPFASPTPTATAVAPTSNPAAVVTETAVPTSTSIPPTATPSGPTRTPTPDLRDEYEWDDTVPKPIFLGTAQTHNFCPNFDVDNVFFLAKAGRTYQITTTNLSPGVDTFLTVTFGETTLTNDDAEAGTLASRITLQAPPDEDIDVVVKITNRGPYGHELTYQILVQEIVPTPTSTPIPSTPATPTSTPTPTNTPTATPDLRDIYEPDDTTPGIISAGDSQVHNFFPDGDVDKMTLPVKEGRIYQAVTSNLAIGVDTYMSITQGDETWENDDYDLLNSGNFAAAVCFATRPDLPLNSTAEITVTTVEQQFSPDKTYTIGVEVMQVPELVVNPSPVAFGVVPTTTTTITQAVALNATENVTWTAKTDTAWLSIDVNTGVANLNQPGSLTLTADYATLPAGPHEGELLVGWSTYCQQVIPVTIEVPSVVASLNSDSDSLVAAAPLSSESPKRETMMAKQAAVQTNEAVEFVIVVELGD